MHNFAVLLWWPLCCSLTKNPNHRHGGLLSQAHPSGSRPLEDICTSSVAPGSFWHAAEGAGITHQHWADWGADWPWGQWRRVASRGVLLSNPVMDTHTGAGGWPVISKVLWRLMGHDEASAPVFIPLSLGMLEVVSECQELLAIAHFWCQLPRIYNCPLPSTQIF